MDTGEGSYLRELSDHPILQIQRSALFRLLKSLEDDCNQLRSQFKKYEYLWLTDMQSVFAAFITDAVRTEKIPFDDIDEAGGSKGVEVESSNTSNGGASKTGSGNRGFWNQIIIDLGKFDEKIRHYLIVQNEISDLKAIYDIDFVKVNAQPIKQAISTWATKWLYLFSSYLQTQLGTKLSELYSFMKNVNSGLDVTLEGISREAVMKVMSHIRDVRKRTPEISSMFEPQRDIVMMLKKHSITIDLVKIK